MLAAEFWMAGKEDLARKYANLEMVELTKLSWEKKNSDAFTAFAQAAATIGDTDSFDTVWNLKAGDLEKARFLEGAFTAIEEKEERRAAKRKA